MPVTADRLKLALACGVWLCPFWLQPTPVIAPLLWAGFGLGVWLILDALWPGSLGAARPLPKPFLLLLVLLGGVIAWRSRSAQDTLAAWLGLATIALAARLSAKTHSARVAQILACAWLAAGLINGVVALTQYFGLTQEPPGQAIGLLRQRNQLASLCNLALLSCFYLSRRAAGSSPAWPYPGLGAAALLLLTATLAATCSRTGLMEFLLCTGGVLAYAGAQKKKPLFVMSLCALLAYGLFAFSLPWLIDAPQSLFGRMSTTLSASDQAQAFALQDSRVVLWRNVWDLIQAHPWVGIGWRELAYVMVQSEAISEPRFLELADNAHNLPLHLAVELGVPFTLVWLALLGWFVLRHRPWHRWRNVQAPHALAWGVLALLAIHSLLEYPLWYAPFQIALGLAIGLAWSEWAHPDSPLVLVQAPVLDLHGHDPAQPAQTWRDPAHARLSLTLGVAVIGFCLYAAFDYHRIRQLFLDPSDRSSLYRDDPMAAAQRSWLFVAQVRFAQFITLPLTPENAQQLQFLGEAAAHFSPEPVVLDKLKRVQALQ